MIEVVISCIWLFLIVEIMMVFILLIYYHCQYCFFFWKFFSLMFFRITFLLFLLSIFLFHFLFDFPIFVFPFFFFFITRLFYTFYLFIYFLFIIRFFLPLSFPFCFSSLLPPYLFKTSPHNLYHVICLLDISHRSKWPAASSCVWLPSLRHFSLPPTSDILIAVFFPLFICLFMSLYSHFYSFIFCIHLLKWWFVIYHYYLF